MDDSKQQERGAIGGSSSLGTQQSGNVTHGMTPEQITNKLKENPGAEFIVVQRVRQGEEPQVWSSGDVAQTEDLFRHAYTSLALKEQTTS